MGSLLAISASQVWCVSVLDFRSSSSSHPYTSVEAEYVLAELDIMLAAELATLVSSVKGGAVLH